MGDGRGAGGEEEREGVEGAVGLPFQSRDVGAVVEEDGSREVGHVYGVRVA